MKTAEEIFMEVQDIECPNVNNLTLPEDWQLKAMKLYSNQKLDEAADLCFNAICYNTHSASEIEKEILRLKDN